MRLGNVLREALSKLDSPVIHTIRGKGLMNAIVINEAAMPGKTAWHVCLLLKRYGLLAKPTHDTIIRLAPPLCITEDQILEAVGIIKRALVDIVAWDLKRDPLE